MMWPQFLIKKILGYRGERLREFFDDLNFEVVVPQVLSYLNEFAKAENAVWVMADDWVHFQRFGQVVASAGINRADNIECQPAQHLYFLSPISYGDFAGALMHFPLDLTVRQFQRPDGNFNLLFPLEHMKSHEHYAFLVFTNVPKENLQSTIQKVSGEMANMLKHLSFCFDHHLVKKETITDDLTGLFNARFLTTILENEIKRAQSNSNKFSILFMDIDFFKSVNDKTGHWVGSRLLSEVGRQLRTKVRRSDYCFRYGGDEFVVLLPNTDMNGAWVAAERIRGHIEKTEFVIDGHRFTLTLSAGIATYPDHAKSYKEIIKMADEAMYCGKNKSRNVVYVAG